MANFVSISKHEFLNLDKVVSISIEPNRMALTLDSGEKRYAEPDYSLEISNKLRGKLETPE